MVVLLLQICVMARAQFTSNISGVVTDPSGAVVPGATLTLHNQATGEEKTATSTTQGVYQFVSLAPGSYTVTATMTGFGVTRSTVNLATNQTLNVPLGLKLSSSNQTVEVTAQQPLLDSADTRLEETLSTQTLSNLPLAGRSMISLVTLAPGVTGTGVTSNGSPGSGRDNFSTETQVDASANGQGAVGNMYVVDGLDVTSSIRPGVLNLTPNPDSIQEASIQTNTYNVEYGRASSIQMIMSTKYGTEHYHGNISDYFFYQKFFAHTEFAQTYRPFHSNNISATIGGPIIPHHSGFFFFAMNPLRQSNAVVNTITFEDPAFTAFAKANFPNTIGTKLLTTYPVTRVTNVAVSSTAATLFPATSANACGTASTSNLPCSTPVIDTGSFSDTAYRNGNQYNVRLDKQFAHDRLYGTYYRVTLKSNGVNPRAPFAVTNTFGQHAFQVNETHTFKSSLLNEAAFGFTRVEGVQPATGLFSIPVVNVTGLGQGFGSGFAQGDFIQHNYHWRDVLTRVYKSHDIRAGYEGLFADDVEVFNGPYDQPTFAFNNILDLARDNVYTEGNLAYDPLTGSRSEYNWNAAGVTHGAFVEDSWKVNRKLTVNYGVRWDDYGNPYSRSASTAFGNFFLGSGTTIADQISNGIVVRHTHALNRSITDVFSPRAGVAWNPDGEGRFVIKGGAGVYHNWPTLANLQEEFRGNPPGNIFPTFFGGQTPAPIFALGTSNQKPFGFPAPALPAKSLNSKGGIPGLQFGIGGIDPNLQSPISYIYSGTVEHSLGRRLVAAVSYAGSDGTKLLSGGGQVYNVSYGQDINAYDGDLIQHKSTVPTRLNTSFGSIFYTQNDRRSRYNALITSVRGRFSRAFFNASYTRSNSKDDTQVYPTWVNVGRYYGPSNWDVPNRFSLAFNYEVPQFHSSEGFVGRTLSGWSLNGTAIAQSGTPFNVFTSASFAAGGDYNADGDNNDYPDVASYIQKTGRTDYLHTGTVQKSNFTAPTPGTEGNEQFNSFRNPGFEQWDASLLKNTRIVENVNFQLRFEFFNLFNRPNLNGVQTNLTNGNFGRSTSQATPRYLQLGANLTF